MSVLDAELGAIRLFAPERIAKNVAMLAQWVRASNPDEQLSDTWDCLRVVMHPDLDGFVRNPTEPVLAQTRGPLVAASVGSLKILPITISEGTLPAIRDNEAKYRECLDLLSRLFPSTYKVFCDLVAIVLLGDRLDYTAGTLSSRVGLIWLAPPDDWSAVDWAEIVLHEFVHNILFVEDMVHSIFLSGTAALAEPDALCLSAIREERRGYDKSYHSAFVAYALVMLNLQLGNNKKAKAFLVPLISCVDELVQRRSWVSANGLAHLAELAAAVLSLSEILGRRATADAGQAIETRPQQHAASGQQA